jgi:hypothetical protein
MKSLKINDTLHKKLKVYCANNGLKMLSFVEKILQHELEKLEKKDEKMEKKVS